MVDSIGKTLKNRYRVDDFLGRGGMADVYKIWDLQRGVVLEMKVLRDDLAEDVVFMRRFEREAQTLTRLQHLNIVRFYGMKRDNLLVLNIWEGSVWKQRSYLVRENYSSWSGPESNVGVYYAHYQRLVHFDIESGNILIDMMDQFYVTVAPGGR